MRADALQHVSLMVKEPEWTASVRAGGHARDEWKSDSPFVLADGGRWPWLLVGQRCATPCQVDHSACILGKPGTAVRAQRSNWATE